MPVETFGYPDSLNASFPPTSDGLVGGDDHIRGIKSTIKNTFPNLTGAVTATQTQINTLVDGVGIVNDAGVFFKTSGDGFVNSLAGDIDVKLQGVIAATFQRTLGTNFFKVKGALQVDTTITSTGAITGPGIAPIGAMVMWPSTTLPPTSEGVWVWANGATYQKADYQTAWERLSNTGTTFTVLNMQEVVPVGLSGMGGATSPGLLASIAVGVKNVIGVLFGNDTKALSTANLPAYTPAGTITNGAITINNATVSGPTATSFSDITPGSVLGSYSAVTISASQAASSFNGMAQGGTSTAFGLHQPSRPVGFIVRLA